MKKKPIVGLVGLGKLGFPVAVTFAQVYTVYGTDIDPKLQTKERSNIEQGHHKAESLAETLPTAKLHIESCMQDVVNKADIIFVAVQTPHDPQFEGITPLTRERKDFDYSHLIKACTDLKACVGDQDKTVVVISTVLPGTIRRHILPLLPNLVYNPFFIAMGTVMQDLLRPEFVLLGSDSAQRLEIVKDFYRYFYQSHEWPKLAVMSIESAELTKVSYNLWISLKIVATNATMELCDKTGADIDDVMGALKLAKSRIISPSYMTGGMGDGGACHTRDCIAMSWASRTYGLRHDIYESIVLAREGQAMWLADLMGLDKIRPLAIFGYAFKAETAITTGSHALLVANVLAERGLQPVLWDPYVDGLTPPDIGPSVILIGCRHEKLRHVKFPPGSYVIDPHRFIPSQPNVTIRYLGRPSKEGHR